MKRIPLAAAVIVSVMILLSGCQQDGRPLHEQIADGMYHDFFDPRWAHLVERYGEEDFTVDPESTAGGIWSTRFDMWVKLFWDEDEKTYKDNYIVYLRQAELIELLDAAFGEVLGEDYKIYVLGYLFCPPSFNKDTTAQELLDASEITDDILVQTVIFTTKDPAGREADLQAIQEAIQAQGWSLQVTIAYIPQDNLDLIPEYKNGNPYSNNVVNSKFYYCRAAAYIRPDNFEWSFTHGWQEGEAQ